MSDVERFCFVRLSDDHATPAGREEVAARCRAVLAGAPEALEVTVGVPADDTARKWDVSCVVRCADLAALRALLARPEVTELLDAWLPSRAAVVKAWHFRRA